MTQSALFRPTPYGEERAVEPSDPFTYDTRREAKRAIEPRSSKLQDAVLGAIRAAGPRGATDDELEVALDLRHQTLSARRRELVQSERIVDSGETRKTRSGRSAVVWVVVAEAA